MNLIESLIEILTEAPMSDEDRRDSDALRAIFQKRANRSNAKLTPSETALLDKYGISLDSKRIMGSDGGFIGNADDVIRMGKTRSSKWVQGFGYPYGKDNSSKVNIADMMRKRQQPDRRYAQRVDDVWYVDDNVIGYGSGGSSSPYRSRDTFQNKEKMRTGVDSGYRKDFLSAKEASGDRKYADSRLSNYDKEIQNIERQYQQDLDKAERDRKSSIDYLDSRNKSDLDTRREASQKIRDIKDKYRRKNESIKGLRRRNKSFSEGFERTKRYYAYVSYWGKMGEPKDKTIEDDTVKGVVRKLRAFAERNEISEINRVSKSVNDNEEFKNICSEFGIEVHSIDLWN